MAFSTSSIAAIKGDAGTNGTNGTDGDDGADGAAGGFGTPAVTTNTVAVDGSGNSQNATCTVAGSGPDTAKVFTFTFGIPVGSTGATGATGTVNTATDYTWTGSQRGTVVAANNGAMDMNVSNNFSITPTGAIQLSYSNETAGQSGYIVLVNTGGYAITKESSIKGGTAFLSDISAAGTYLIGYHTLNSSNVYVTNSVALS